MLFFSVVTLQLLREKIATAIRYEEFELRVPRSHHQERCPFLFEARKRMLLVLDTLFDFEILRYSF